jgi:hypothetical protein
MSENPIQEDWKNITDLKKIKKAKDRAYSKNFYFNNKNKKKAYYEANKDKYKLYYETNKDKILKSEKIYQKINKDKIKAYRKIRYNSKIRENNENKERCKVYYQINKDKIKVYGKTYREINKEKLKIYHRNRRKINAKPKLSKEEIENKRFLRKIANRLRQRLCKAIKRNYKNGSAIKDLGCSVSELKIYLENKFQEKMSWDNWGTKGWHIDHIKPLSSFDLTDRNQFLQACHYTNLQPLWAKDNIAKSDKIL